MTQEDSKNTPPSSWKYVVEIADKIEMYEDGEKDVDETLDAIKIIIDDYYGESNENS